MIDFICILFIFLEIFLTVFCCKRLMLAENKVDEIHVKMLVYAKELLKINDEIKNLIKKINKVVRILSNKRLHQVKRIIMMTLDIIQVVILFRSLDVSNGFKSIKFDTIKKLLALNIGQQIIRKILSSVQNFCAI